MPDVSQGRLTPLTVRTPADRLFRRVSTAIRNVFTREPNFSAGVDSTWMGPGQPQTPMAPETKGRNWQYDWSINVNYLPRATEPVSFEQLRALAQNCDILRGVIENRKKQVRAFDVVFRPRSEEDDSRGIWDTAPQRRGRSSNVNGVISEEQRTRIRAVTQFFNKPNRVYNWGQWVAALLEDLLVIDAATLYRRPTRGGGLWSLDLIDGATIKPLVDADGRRPLPPDPAYQQVLYGVPTANFMESELLYRPSNVRTYSLYGQSPVEQVILTVNIAIRRAMHQLEYYRSGSNPDAFVGLPDTWNLTQIKEFQTWFDSMMSGNLAERRKTRFMPGQFKYQETKTVDLKDMYDEWLARIICYAFDESPDPFALSTNRATQQGQRNRSLEQGMLPTLKWLKMVIDEVLAEDFESPDLEIAFVENRETDPSAQANIDVAYVKAGIRSIDEVRVARGLDPLGGAYSKPMLATAQGYIEVGKLTGVEVADAQAEAAMATGAEDGQKTTGVEDAPSEADDDGVRTQSTTPVERGSRGNKPQPAD